MLMITHNVWRTNWSGQCKVPKLMNNVIVTNDGKQSPVAHGAGAEDSTSGRGARTIVSSDARETVS